MKLLLWLSLPLYAIDQATKFAILNRFPGETGFGEGIEVIPGFFDIVRVHNTGMAFGGFNDAKYSNVIFCAIATIALAVITVLWRRGAFPTTLSRVAAALLISGVLGNMTDRLLHRYVVDFLSFDLGFMIWPSFNVADSCICVAAVLLMCTAFSKDSPQPQGNEN